MADAAKLTIEIADAPEKSGGTDTSGAELLDKWRGMVAQMSRIAEEAAGRLRTATGSGGSGSGGGGGRGRPTNPGYEAAKRGKEMARISMKGTRHRQKQIADAEKERKQKAEDARKAWAKLGRESAARGRKMAAMNAKATAARKKQFEETERPMRQRQQRRVAHGLAWRKGKTRQRRMEALYKRKATNLAVGAGAGYVAATAIRGGNTGTAAGSSLGAGVGTALGARFGPAGAALGGQVGEAIGSKAGAFVDNPLAGPASFGQKVARGDSMGALTGAADNAAMALALIPGVGTAAALAIKSVTSSFNAVKETADAFAARGRELAGYNGSIAGAVAMQDITRTLTDIREAQQMGDKYAALIDAQTRFEETLKAGLLPIKEYIVELLPKVMDTVLGGIMQLITIGYAIPGVKDDAVTKVLKNMQDMIDALKGGMDDKDIMDAWLKTDGFGFDAAGEKPKAGPLGIPLIPAP